MAMASPVKIGFNRKSPEHILALDRVREWTRERFRLSGDTLEAVVTVEDADTFNEPLHMMQRWRRVRNQMLETVCAENNGDHFNKNLFPIPQSDKPDF